MMFPDILLDLRTKRGLSQKEVAGETGIGLRAYQRYEYGQREPQLSVLIRLADYFDLSLDELVGRERHPD